MEASISDDQVGRFSDFVADRMGLHFPRSRWPDLRRGLAAAANALGLETEAECARQLMSATASKQQLELLADHLTVGETYFFREHRSFEVLGEHVLPSLIRARQAGERRLRLWSAACCTGEEVYSIAITLRRVMPDLKSWNVTLLATDINPRFLRKAKAGVFGSWSFRDSPSWLREQNFRKTEGGQFEILPEIQRMVRFAQLNLVEEVYPSKANETDAMDVIFCRNVLMYFTTNQAKKVLCNLHRAQAQNGWLIVGAGELSHASASPYTTVSFAGATLYQKQCAKPQPLIEQMASSSGTTLSVPSEMPRGDPAPPIASARERAAPAAPDRASEIDEPLHGSDLQIEVLYEQGRYAEVTDELSKLLARQPNEPRLLKLLIRSLANERKLAESVRYCDKWVAIEKFNPSAHYLRALLLQESGATDEAIQALRRALYIDPNFAIAHFAMGNIARSQGRHHEADKCFIGALRSLHGRPADEELADSEGMRVGRLIEIIGTLMNAEKAV